MSASDVAAWQERLETTFGQYGMSESLWTDVPPKEAAYEAYVRGNAHGYLVIANSFQSFFYDSLIACLQQYVNRDATTAAPYQPPFFLNCLTLFRSCRSTNTLLLCGYPLDAYALLRDVVDRTIFLGAWTLGLTSYQALNGTQALNDAEGQDRDKVSDAIRKARENEQRRLLRLMMGSDSGLDQDTILWLRRWKSLFNLEVHGSRLTTAAEFAAWVKRREGLSIGPVPRDESVTTFINTAPEGYWMILRLLPFLQLSSGAFGDDWAAKWRVLDESFDFYQAGLEKLGKPMGTAVRRLIEKKFTLTPQSAYVEYGPDS